MEIVEEGNDGYCMEVSLDDYGWGVIGTRLYLFNTVDELIGEFDRASKAYCTYKAIAAHTNLSDITLCAMDSYYHEMHYNEHEPIDSFLNKAQLPYTIKTGNPKIDKILEEGKRPVRELGLDVEVSLDHMFKCSDNYWKTLKELCSKLHEI